MALKDWKINKKYKNHYINKTSKEDIAIVFDYIGYKNKWLIVIEDGCGDIVKQKIFKTKSQALKFAKAYMRKH